MKVNKQPQVSAKSLKWKDVRSKRCRSSIKPPDLNFSQGIVEAKTEHQASVKKRPSVKRLKNKAKTFVDHKTSHHESVPKKTRPQTNGSSATPPDEEVEDLRDLREYSKLIADNCSQSPTDTPNLLCGRLEGEALHHCAQRDDQHNHVVLVLQQNQTLCFRGKCFLTCLFGRVEVMGFSIEEGQKSYPIFSPASHCPLTVRALETSHCSQDDKMEASQILQKYLQPQSRKKLLKNVTFTSSIVLLEPMDTSLTRFLSSFHHLNELFSPLASELVSADYDTPLNSLGVTPLSSAIEGLSLSRSFRDALNTAVSACRGDMDGCAVILVCGTKNVGKSTFIRVLINTLLNHTSCVDYLEGDLGQTEFTPAGCLSMLPVTEPLLGPPFTHQITPEHMIYYGDSSCEADLDRYLESLKCLWRQRPKSREAPVIINTMGWVKGFGFQLLVDMIRLLPISHVIQLGHGGTTQCPALTPMFLRTAEGFQTHPPAMDEIMESYAPPKNYTHLIVQSEFEGVARQGTTKHQRSNEQQELSLMSYLSMLQFSESGPVTPLHSLIPYQVPHTAVALGVTHCEVAPSHMFYAANANLVGLCCLAEKVTSKGGPVLLTEAPVCPCVGFGVLRGIDMERGLYYLLTPVDPLVLKKVNCLLLGAISLPSCILTAQSGFEGEVPYVTSDYSFELTGAGKLRVFKGLTRPSHAGLK